MSYRKAWRLCRSVYPDVHAINNGDNFRISKHPRGAREDGMEFYALEHGMTRKEAWERAAIRVQQELQGKK